MRDAGRRALVVAVFVLTGCAPEARLYPGGSAGPAAPRPAGGGTTDVDMAPDDYGDQALDEIAVREGRLFGQIGDVSVDTAEPMLRAYRDWSNQLGSVEVHGQTEAGAAMFAMYAYPSLDAIDLPVGTRVLLEETTLDDVTVLTVGCAGQVAGEWDYDAPPERTVMTITDFDQDGAVEIGFEATFGAEQTSTGVDETVVARFELTPQ